MRFFKKVLACLTSVGMLAGLSVSVVPRGAFASTVPFQDENQQGTLTFCNQNGQAVTSGNLLTVPFVWRAVSSVPAPTHYTRAYLDLFQPMQYEDPADWTGYQLTVQAVYSNPNHPMAQATYADQPLLWPDQQMPPYWDGLYQVRMYFSQPLISPYSGKYPAAVIRVTGENWMLVSGGGGSCNVGTAESIETLRLPKSETETPHVLSANGKNLVVAGSASATVPASGRASASSSASTVTASHGAPSARSTPSTEAKSTALAAGRSTSGSGGLLVAEIVAIGVGAAVVLLAAGLWLRRRRRGQARGTGESPAPA